MMTLAKGHLSVVCQHFQKTFPLKYLGQFHLNLYAVSRQRGGEGGKLMYLAQVAAMPIYGKYL